MKKTSGIYQIELGNGYFYIGSAADLLRRQREHLKQLRSSKHHNKFAQNCWNKYQTFVFIVLEECKVSELLGREQFFIDQHFGNAKNINIAPTAGSCLGRVHSAETRKKMSDWQMGKVLSDETKKRISLATKGKKGFIPSAETNAKRSASLRGRVHSAESRKKMSDTHKLRWARVKNGE
jgi:group I intron endonuclease